MKLITALTPIIIALIAGVLGQPLVQLLTSYQRRKLKKINNVKEVIGLFEKFETDFQTKFILSDLKETFFYIQTGIKTNEKSIEKYINFKNLLGKNYTWNHIKIIQPHIKIQNNELSINLNKFQKVFTNIILVLSFILFIISFILFFYLDQFETNGVRDVTLKIITVITPMFFGFFFMKGVNSLVVAKGMEKTLKSIEKNCN